MDASDLSPACWPAEPSLEWGDAGDGALALTLPEPENEAEAKTEAEAETEP